MLDKLKSNEMSEYDQYGAIRYTIDDFCDRFSITKTGLGVLLGVTRIQVHNYRVADRVIELDPVAKEISILTKEKVLKTIDISEEIE